MRFDGAFECGGHRVRDEFGVLPRRHFAHCHRHLDSDLRHTANCSADLRRPTLIQGILAITALDVGLTKLHTVCVRISVHDVGSQ